MLIREKCFGPKQLNKVFGSWCFSLSGNKVWFCNLWGCLCFVWGVVKGKALELEEIRPQMETKGDCCCFQSLSGLNGTLCDPVTAPHPTCVSEATVLSPCWRTHFRRARDRQSGRQRTGLQPPYVFLKQPRLAITFHCMCGFVSVPKASKTDS